MIDTVVFWETYELKLICIDFLQTGAFALKPRDDDCLLVKMDPMLTNYTVTNLGIS